MILESTINQKIDTMQKSHDTTPEKAPEKTNAAELLENLLAAVTANSQIGKELLGRFNSAASANDILDQKIESLALLSECFPEEVEIKIKEQHYRQIEKINKNLYALKVLYYLSIGVLVFGIVNIALLQSLGRSWYKESIKTKKEFMAEVQQEGSVIVSRSAYTELKRNTEMMQQFIKANPRDSAPLLIFQKGYELSGQPSK